MPWEEVSTVSLRREFVELAQQPDANFSALCQRYQVSRKTGYKWLKRYRLDGELGDRSRRPLRSPRHTGEAVACQVGELRRMHPAWGGRKIARRLRDLGLEAVPAPSTITHILRRQGLLYAGGAEPAVRWQRFEHAAANDLWQIDFKGHFQTSQGRCHPLTVLDDHSRFNLVLKACTHTDTASVQPLLIQAFQRYGLPMAINADNGSPWGSPSQPGSLSELTVWWIRLGIRVSHSRPYHPQTNGKEERFHRSLKAEVLNGRAFASLQQAQQDFDRWRNLYNHQRPHEALSLEVPATRYAISTRAYPATLPAIQYAPDDQIRQVQANGLVCFKGLRLKVSNALRKQPVAFRPLPQDDGLYELYFCHHRLLRVDLAAPP